jgi:hypothetical protein
LSDSTQEFADRIRQRYPEGLTGIVAVGGTRTTYILEHNRSAPDPGVIRDFEDYARQMLGKYMNLVSNFFALGGQNVVMPLLSYQRFDYERGEGYIHTLGQYCLWLTQGHVLETYRLLDADPYFVGIDTLLRFSERAAACELAEALDAFQRQWQYQPGRRRIIWEIAPISLFSMWEAQAKLDDESRQTLESAMKSAPSLEALAQTMYKFYAKALYGTDLPMPHFYLGSNRNGDMKLRAFLPFALYMGSPLRLYYTPYPSLFTTRETLMSILEDLAFGKTLSATSSADYTGKFTTELAEAEYQRVIALASTPDSVIGWTRRPGSDDE